jgi:hypothetical protein
MLLGDRIPTEALRQKSYEILDRETRRLRTLVEGCLTSAVSRPAARPINSRTSMQAS